VQRVGPAARPKHFRVAVACLAAAIVALGLAACAPVKEPPPPVVVTTNPALFPAFDGNVPDYVVRCDPNTPTDVQVDAPADTTVSVNGSPPASGQFSVSVPQDIGEQFAIDVTIGGDTTTHHVRCLPNDFPTWTVQKNGPTQADFYATVLVQGFGPPNYSVVFDANGVPVWWLARKPTLLLQPFSNAHLAIVKLNGGMEEYSLDGKVQQSLNTVGANADFHDVALLPNGDYVMATVQQIPCDLSSWGVNPPLQNCLDHVFQEIKPGTPPVLQWTWDTFAHIPVSETAQEWIAEQKHDVTNGVYDPYHYNALEPINGGSDGFILNFRHLDAAYRISKPTDVAGLTGPIQWKLGGIARPESLSIVDDPLGGVSGQHDARLLPDGSVTLHDNGTLGLGPGRPPRAVRYVIDTQAKTATFAGALTDSEVPSSGCCGSARLLPDGDVVTGWGGTPQIAEYAPDGTRLFRISGTFVYRGTPLLPGQFTAQQFRDGMDAQFASGLSAQAAEPPADLGSSPLAATLHSMQCCSTPR
jgi:Arylsulfotransferase (ASST)